MKKRLQSALCLFIFTMVLIISGIYTKRTYEEAVYDVSIMDGTNYVEIPNKTLNEKTTDIIDIDWKNMSTEELDAILGESDYKYVGLFLSRLSDEELELLRSKSRITGTTVGELKASYDEELKEYVTVSQTETDFIEYCLSQYENDKDELFTTSDWDCRTTEGVFYLSSPDRKKIYKYTVTGFYEHAWCIGTAWKPAFTDADLGIRWSVYKNETSAYTFPQPKPTGIKTYISSVRATQVNFFKADGTYLYTHHAWNYIGEGTDDALPYVGVTIDFSNYSNTRNGYHNSESQIAAYNAGDGIGTSTTEAMIRSYTYGGSQYPERNNVNFSKSTPGYVEYKYEGVFNPGYDMWNATTVEESLSSWTPGARYDITILTDETSVNDTTGTFTMNVFPHIGLGTKWYGTYDNQLMVESDIPEFVFNLAPNTYTVAFDGNGATSGSTPSQVMTYDVGYHLNANGFTRTGYTFAGWSASPNGPVQYNDGHYVSNMTATNGGIVTLYAQWTKDDYYIIHFDGNGADSGSMSDMVCSFNTGYNLTANSYTREGYTFSGWSASPNASATGSEVLNDKQYINNMSATNGATVTLYAQWTKDDCYIIHFDGNGADSGSMSDMVCSFNTGYNLTANSYTREGYTFSGWSASPNASATDSEVLNDKQYINNMSATGGATVTLYAQWIPNKYTIKFDGNGGRGTMTDMTCTYDELYTLPSNKFTKVGYDFEGWSLIANGTVDYANEATFKNLHSTTGIINLYAIWAPAEVAYTVNHYTENLNAGWTLDSTDNLIGYTEGILSVNTLAKSISGFTYGHAEVNNVVVSTAQILADGSLVIDLYYTRNSYTVTLDKDSGISSVSGAGTYKYGDTVNINAVVANGYTWNCWTGDFSSTAKAYQFMMPASDVTMKANTGSGVYKITLDNQGATTTGATAYYQKYGIDIYSNSACTSTITNITVPTKTGYTFGGYYTSTNGSGTQYIKADGTITATSTTFTDNTTLYAQWTPITYTIVFDGNGATSGSMSNISATYDKDVTIPENGFAKTGYNFVGWNTKADGSGTNISDKATIKNLTSTNGATVTLYAQWATGGFILTLNHNGGTFGGVTSNSYPVIFNSTQNNEVSDKLPSKTGYIFDGYWTATSGGTQVFDATGICINDNIHWKNGLWCKDGDATLYAHWIPITYTIAFDGNGATGGGTASLDCVYDVSVTLTANGYKRTGYTFTGWNTKVDGSGTSYANKAIVKNVTSVNGTTVTLYAQWISNTYTIAFYGNGATSGSMSNISAAYDKDVRIPENGFVKTGYNFVGWNTKADGSGTNISDKATIKNLTSTNGATVTLYAQWATGGFILTLNHNGGTFGGVTSNSYPVIFNSTQNNDVSDKLPSKTGYIFDGYWTTLTGGTQVFSANGICINDNIHWKNGLWCKDGDATLYAHWIPITYTIAFDGNGATGGSTASLGCTYDVSATLTANGYKKTGYIFAGWNTKADGSGTSYTDKASVKNLTSVNGITITLYAQWTPDTYTIVFDGNGSTSGIMEKHVCAYNSRVQLPANRFAKTHYSFVSWNTESDGSGMSYIDRSYVENLAEEQNKVITLYAQWSPNTYTVHFDANGGEGVMENVVLSYDLPENLPYNSFTRNNGYGDSVFLGWNIVPDTREVLYRDGAEALNMTEMDGSTLTLYAVWDDCPWIIAEDLYYTLEEARSGLITYDELMNRASAEDREAGGIVQPGIDEGNGTSFAIIDYAETDFTQFGHDGSVTETYRVIDSIGNEYKKMITVHIVDTATAYINPERTTRFINEKYYYESYENGGLEDNSIWKTNPEYVQVIEQAFENGRNNTPIMSFHFTHEEILAMKEFVRVNGIGNFKREDALQRFYEQFMEPNIMN